MRRKRPAPVRPPNRCRACARGNPGAHACRWCGVAYPRLWAEPWPTQQAELDHWRSLAVDDQGMSDRI